LNRCESSAVGHRDYLSEYLAHAPAALALLRAIECRELDGIEFPRPLLDLGCGDGLFGQVFFEDKPELGLDFSMDELRTSVSRDAYQGLVQSDITQIACGDETFASVFSNGVLEHVCNVGAGLSEIARVLRPGGRLIFTVPTMEDERQLTGAALLRAAGLKDLSEAYAGSYNRIFGQINMHTAREWSDMLAESGLSVVHHRHYGHAMVFRLHDLTLPLSLPNFVCKRLTGRWSVLTELRRVTVAPLWARALRGVYAEQDAPGCSLLVVAEKRADC